jgi:hypothetical protein
MAIGDMAGRCLKCDEPPRAQGLCSRHYEQHRRQPSLHPKPHKLRLDLKCPECSAPVKAYRTGTRCRACKSTVLSEAGFNRHLRIKYGITRVDYDSLLRLQGDVCAICRKGERARNNTHTGKKRLAVDHDHLTGKVRGLLCSNCNRCISAMDEDGAWLYRAAEYFGRHYWEQIATLEQKAGLDLKVEEILRRHNIPLDTEP